jgi:uncharacterized protein
MKIVLDTNVLVSGMMRADSPPGRIIDHLRSGELHLVLDDRILEEYTDVLRRTELAPYFLGVDIEYILDYIRFNGETIIVSRYVSGLPDPGDASFLEVALSANVPLVTGNRRHYPTNQQRGIDVLTPAEFVVRFLTYPSI